MPPIVEEFPLQSRVVVRKRCPISLDLARVVGHSRDGTKAWVIVDGRSTRKAVNRRFLTRWITVGEMAGA